jgi:heme/copper-type cytochrome/quinol oxidase subunit 1
MSIAMFIVGAFIFAVYVAFLFWNIFYNHNKNREENYPNYYARHGYPQNKTSRIKSKKEEVE